MNNLKVKCMKRKITFIMILSLLLIIVSQTATATQYSDINESAMQIHLFNPKYNFTYDNVTRLVFNFESTGTCDVYTNYTGRWKKIGEKFWILDGSGTAQIIYVNFTNAGTYDWNVHCYNVSGGDSTWAEEYNRQFYIVPPIDPPEINDTEEINQTPQNNETNQTINNTQTPQNNETNQTQTNESVNIKEPVLLNCAGCENKGICYEFEAKIMIDGKQATCNPEGVFTRPMENGETCSENADCASNYCLNSFCRTDWIITTILAAFGFY